MYGYTGALCANSAGRSVRPCSAGPAFIDVSSISTMLLAKLGARPDYESMGEARSC